MEISAEIPKTEIEIDEIDMIRYGLYDDGEVYFKYRIPTKIVPTRNDLKYLDLQFNNFIEYMKKLNNNQITYQKFREYLQKIYTKDIDVDTLVEYLLYFNKIDIVGDKVYVKNL